MDLKVIADGIYFSLSEKLYRHDPALGSTDIGKLRTNPANYWFESPMNPRYRSTDTAAKIRGRAMHTHVLEGKKAFHKLYAEGPEHAEDMTSGEKAAATRKAREAADRVGKTMLSAEDYERVSIASAMITLNRHLQGAFSGGEPEVSVFWTRDGVRRKARFDYLKPRGIGDLKSIANTRELDFETACRQAIANYRYDIQAAHYLEARGMFEVLPFNANVEFLEQCAKTAEYAFQWIFVQTERAPLTCSFVVSPANPILEVARREIDVATDNYKRFMDQFGADQMWRNEQEPQELAIEDMPGWWK